MTTEKNIMKIMETGQNEALESFKNDLEKQMQEHYAKALALAVEENWRAASQELKQNNKILEQYMTATRKQTGVAFKQQIAVKKRAKESVSLWKKMIDSWNCRLKAEKLDEQIKKISSY